MCCIYKDPFIYSTAIWIEFSTLILQVVYKDRCNRLSFEYLSDLVKISISCLRELSKSNMRMHRNINWITNRKSRKTHGTSQKLWMSTLNTNAITTMPCDFFILHDDGKWKIEMIGRRWVSVRWSHLDCCRAKSPCKVFECRNIVLSYISLLLSAWW